MEEALVAWLLSDVPLAALVGNRINWLDRPTAALPAVTLQLIDAGTEYTHEARNDVNYPRVQLDVWGLTYSSCKQVSRRLIALLDNGSDQPEVIFFEGIEVNNSDRPPEALDGGTKVFRVLLEFLVPHKLKEA